MELVRRLERFAAPFVLVMTAVLVVWAVREADGLGPIMRRGSTLDDVWPVYKDPFYDVGWQYTVPYVTYTTGVAYRRAEAGGDFDAVTDFEQHGGRIGFGKRA